ncbi:MAG: tRNA (adenosine(37)-N6)-threonylcarbamoyltransferase complex transferase subunit TsaD [Lentisphaerae bacterium RIFOXYC12_FULL_60_16]|nr:MAG: tRNA (adenosine(37)-N6)-threonylcarbamoyltransferase complex transferase subunit TsaD [Lentisphaerae bacterium RIFOXYC12_FULL_60_16]
MLVLGIETSCDETAVALVRDGREVLCSLISSQVDLHAPFGGVVPELASRQHLEALPLLLEEALRVTSLRWADIDAVAGTYGPGLASSLLIGFSSAKALAFRLGKPLCAVNHMEAHIYSMFLNPECPLPSTLGPVLVLVVSGGHTNLVRMPGPGHYQGVGHTLDDAAGEAFDKGAKLMGLGYPGGPLIDRTAQGHAVGPIPFPRSRGKAGDGAYTFSFSGLKTFLRYYLRDHPLSGSAMELGMLAASYQEAIVDALVSGCDAMLLPGESLAAVGGVSLNRTLRSRLKALADQRAIRLHLSAPAYCADNAAMVAGLAGTGQGIWGDAAFALDVDPSLEVPG